MMKKGILLIASILISLTGFSQKKELRDASKAIKSNSFVEAKTTLSQIEGTIVNEAPEVQAEYYLYKGLAYLGTGGSNDQDLVTAANAFKKVIEIESSGKTKLTSEAEVGMENLRIKLVNSAIADQNAERYAQAAKKLYTSYTISKKDTSDLYFAADNALRAQDNDLALTYYEKLKELGYTGMQKEFTAIDKESGEERAFANKQQRDLMMLSGDYIKASEKIADSRRGEVLRNIAFLYIDKERTDEAKLIIDEARKENPNDISLVHAEAGIALRLNDMKTYNKLMQKIIASDPNNPEMYFNLGVSFAAIGDKENAEKYYLKAIDLDSEYYTAKLNLAVMILEGESAIIEEMNALGTTSADNKRYEVLKTEREELFKKSIPYLESALESQPNDEQIMRTLMNMYTIIGEDEKFTQMKQRIDSLKN